MPGGAAPYSKDPKVRARRIGIVEYLLGNPTDKPSRTLAEKYHCSLRTIENDFQSPEVVEIFHEYIKQVVKTAGLSMAWKNVFKRLKAGDPHISTWLIEKSGFFPKEGTESDAYEAFLKRLEALIASTADDSGCEIDGLVEYVPEPPSAGNGHASN